MAVASFSDDAGSSWTRHELYSGSNYGYVRALAVDPSDPDRVLCLGYMNSTYTLWHTDDQGGTWNSNTASGYTGTPADLAVCPDNGDLLAAASSSGLYSSSDGGSTWTKVTSSFGGANDLVESTLFNGLLIATEDQGVWLWEDWSGTPVQVGSDLEYPNASCLAETQQHLYAGTDGCAVWRSYNPVGVSGSQWGQGQLNVTVTPNPVRGLAEIELNLPVRQMVDVAVYDITGRRVLDVFGGTAGPDPLSVCASTSDLNSGVYFVTLSTETGSESARMVILEE
ncbi:MAG: T9SS type A sorting domain-containing protein [Candidatus Aegiribacteria sp.]|nr:T9SS type A sorting domain-containing protein [Candidatus Aegiribacteria sp.]MBD3294149.1 T9SS type A sorting domain-containing protein [Candidatus Fermentibacteria bacterium]